MVVLRVLAVSLLFIILTVLTQVGGLLFLLSLATHRQINDRFKHKVLNPCLKLLAFILIYTIVSFIILPPVAGWFGRVALPFTETSHLRPLNKMTYIFNRQYVRPELRQMAIGVAQDMNEKFPGTVVNYLDANFPFLNGFPLIPHLSHNDGRKLDLAFFYIDNNSGKACNNAPSFIGYGINEEPRGPEVNTAERCADAGYWQYSLLTKWVSQNNKSQFNFDSVRTTALVNLLASKSAIEKIFIEPHLKARLKLKSNKIRFHGCRAVRHDDHIHIQVK